MKMKPFMTIIAIITMLTLAIGCGDTIKTGKSTKKEMEQTEVRQQILVKANPPIQIENSLERVNLNKRIKRFNDPNKVSYIYLCSSTGQIYTMLTIKGKVSSLNSLLTTPVQIVGSRVHSASDTKGFLLPSPDLDGSYGANPDGIFGFTTDDTYFEWNGSYFLCDKPLKLAAQPLMTLAVPE